MFPTINLWCLKRVWYNFDINIFININRFGSSHADLGAQLGRLDRGSTNLAQWIWLSAPRSGVDDIVVLLLGGGVTWSWWGTAGRWALTALSWPRAAPTSETCCSGTLRKYRERKYTVCVIFGNLNFLTDVMMRRLQWSQRVYLLFAELNN